jgi:DNA polymerase-3 subunit epsilon
MNLAALATRLQLARPLAFVDIEATGLNPRRSRIVDFGVLKLYPDGTHKAYDTLVNPGVPIPSQVSVVHGITDAMVADAPTWATVGPVVAAGLQGADLAAYGGRYDQDILRAEMARHQIAHGLDDSRLVDPLRLWQKQEPRTLADFLKRFGGVTEATSHRAGKDVAALVVGFLGMLEVFNLPTDVQGLHDLGADPTWIDRDGKLAWMGGRCCLNFGENRGEALEDVAPGVRRWMLGADFSDHVKAIVKMAQGGKYLTCPDHLKVVAPGTEAG